MNGYEIGLTIARCMNAIKVSDTMSVNETTITIPNGVTNGDVIKALFPLGNAEPYMSCSKDWWNAPYKAESEDKE